MRDGSAMVASAMCPATCEIELRSPVLRGSLAEPALLEQCVSLRLELLRNRYVAALLRGELCDSLRVHRHTLHKVGSWS